MGQVIFVVWRECFEALLVIGIIYSWIRQHPDRHRGMRYLYGGVALGVLVSVVLALIIYGVFNVLQGTSQTLFMMAMGVVACILIVQMVYWMNKHGKTLKNTLESEISKTIAHTSWWGALFIIAIAIAREGSEIVVFLSNQIMQLNLNNYMGFMVAVVIGIVLSAITFYAFILTSKLVSWKKFFTITGVVLLFLALSLLLKAFEDGINILLENDVSVSDFLINPAWDSSFLINDNSIWGDFLTSFFAYRSQPMWLSVIVFVAYWCAMGFIFLRRKEK